MDVGDGGAEVLDEGIDALEGAEVRGAAEFGVYGCCHWECDVLTVRCLDVKGVVICCDKAGV